METNIDKQEINITGVSTQLLEMIETDLNTLSPNNAAPNRKRIAFSISDSEDLEELGMSSLHLQDSIIELTRHLLVQGATIVYGGDLRKNGFLEKFLELSFQYRVKDDAQYSPFINYFSYPIYCTLTLEQEVKFKKNRVRIVKVKPEAIFSLDEKDYQIVSHDTIENTFLWAKNLTKMRIEKNLKSDALILMGGKLGGFIGCYAGIIEEAYEGLKTQKPIYLIGMFGGATRCLIQSITQKTTLITSEHKDYFSEKYKALQHLYQEKDPSNIPSVEAINTFFQNLSWKDLHNGLTEEENIRLFQTNHLMEAIYLVMKGLRNCL
ncbi:MULTISPECIES: hypothetical protein [unclassified Arcicella]|uniref:hypothetical protein n=1 Tax=unclassified Arcicella TaxID=2644986 RepID=UPI002864D774|nr:MULTISPECIES: hypothetical protein [unclassified Arcicella]MDR6564131.1 hypothetical protein [Arcicella sp. BE51]MDR6813884.1 hypothetical protein [Arcicella sp. BE140]MDR6825196.1 hypothetical protein [Arcicella sp. BE139]